ncbi:MAG TPA: tetratricopeptide repeat protein [Aggregatilinea sp.]|uniref:tetratricopeptide repeat protein n=1 Tax=Aggregatilinea sp. TaxID=2806333 RepID=UPI002C094DE1|nr:tetratricopeptide repeat protein [Aggregatilinea sp.]HML20476.1 tetratricopeptide repeat protein [Aggregatilinea sp.]
MLREVVRWLGPHRTRLIAALLIGTGALMLGFQVAYSGADWLAQVQIGLVWLFVAGLMVVVSTQINVRVRRRFWTSVGPGLVLLALGIFIPDYAVFFAGGGFGWLIIAPIILRTHVRMEYQQAIRHMRHGELDEAIAVMDELVQTEPDDPEHYQFRADLHRLANHPEKAQQDYEQVIRLDPDSASGYIGLSEVRAQSGDFEAARAPAQQAVEHDPQSWLPAYNLGMIEDRLDDPAQAVEHLQAALKAGLPHRRYHVLVRLWLARSYVRLGQREEAGRQVEALRAAREALNDWNLVFESEQAALLRALMEPDVRLAERLVQGSAGLEVLERFEE